MPETSIRSRAVVARFVIIQFRSVPCVQAVFTIGHQAMPAPEKAPPTRAEDYRVPAGHLAVTLDFASMKSTVALDAARLAGVLNSLDLAFVGIPYSSVLAQFGRAFPVLKRGEAMPGLDLVPFLRACRYPTGTETIKRAVSDHLRRFGSAHVTIHAGAKRGVAIAVAAGFVDLENSLTESKKTGAAAVTVARPGMARETFQ